MVALIPLNLPHNPPVCTTPKLSLAQFRPIPRSLHSPVIMNFLVSLVTRAINAISPSKSSAKKPSATPDSVPPSPPPAIPPPSFESPPQPRKQSNLSEDSPRISKIAAKAAALKKLIKAPVETSPQSDSETSPPNAKQPRRTAKKDPEPRPMKRAKIEVRGSVAAKPTTARRPPAKRCQICSKVLKAGNFASLADHSGCQVCFSCIKSQNHTILLCPVCKSGYTKKSKDVLENKIPGLMELLADNKRTGATMCDTCGADTELSARHECSEGKVRCLACHEYLIATKCFRKKCACPRCRAVPHELYISCAKRSCAKCGKEVNLNEIAHWCEDRQYLACDECKPECGCSSLEGGKVAK